MPHMPPSPIDRRLTLPAHWIGWRGLTEILHALAGILRQEDLNGGLDEAAACLLSGPPNRALAVRPLAARDPDGSSGR